MCTPNKNDDCIICTHPIEELTRAPMITCRHDCFHESCLADWFKTQRHSGRVESCPVCRKEAENDYATIVSHPFRKKFAIIEKGFVSYYAGNTRHLTEEIPRNISNLRNDLVNFIGPPSLVIRRHSFVRLSSSLICRADSNIQLDNALNYFLMSRFRTRRQRELVLSKMTPGNIPFVITEHLTEYNIVDSLKSVWKIDTPVQLE